MNPLLKLYARNRRKGEFRAEVSPEGDAATIYLYDMIVDTDDEAEWLGGVSPQKFIKTLNSMKAPEIHLRVYSPGGSVFAARAMEQAIREHSSRIVVHNDGLAASAASFLILPADEIIVAPGAFTMIHKAWTIACGNSDELLKTAGLLEQVDGSLVKSYAERTGQKPEEIAAWMAAETWMDADRAVELGFADSIADGKDAPSAKAWDLSAFEHAPKSKIEETPAQPDREALRRAALARLIPA